MKNVYLFIKLFSYSCKPFSTLCKPYLYPLTKSENQSFFEVFIGYRSGILVKNGLRILLHSLNKTNSFQESRWYRRAEKEKLIKFDINLRSV